MHTHPLRGVKIPDIGDSIVESIETAVQTTISALPVDNHETAQSVLEMAESEGKGATGTSPALFLVGQGVDRLLYSADGSRDPLSRKFELAPVSQVDHAEDTAVIGKTFAVSPGGSTKVISSSLPIRPYPRSVFAVGMLWGDVTGEVNIDLRIGTDSVFSQFQSRDNSTVSVINIGDIPANVDPDIGLWVTGGPLGQSSGSIYLSRDPRWNRLAVLAFPSVAH